VQILRYFSAPTETLHVVGIDVSSRTPATAALAWEDYRRVRTEGFWAPGDEPSFLEVRPSDRKLQFLSGPNEHGAELGIPAPDDLPASTDRVRVVINNDQMLVLSGYPLEAPAANDE
jgi:hypothetical protein